MEAISQLLEAMHLPTVMAIAKCPAHQKQNTLVTKENSAEEAARRAAVEVQMVPLLVEEDLAPLIMLSKHKRELMSTESCLG